MRISAVRLLFSLYMQTLMDFTAEAWMQAHRLVKTKYYLHCCKMRHVRVTLGL